MDEEDALLADIYGGLRQRRARSSKAGTVQDFGGKLFDAVFTGDIEHLYRSSLASAARGGKGLRVLLRLPEDSALHAKPWEFLFDTNGDWKEVPESSAANACFLTSIRLPVEGLCQVSYQGAEERWTYNISNPKTAGFMCTATCIWIDLQKPPRVSTDSNANANPDPGPGTK